MKTPEYQHLRPGAPLPRLGDVPFKAVVVIECDVTPEWQAEVSDWLVRSGCRYLIAWGLRCGDWDTSVDEANLALFGSGEIPDDDLVMTSWHEEKLLQESFWYCENCAFHPSLNLAGPYIVHIASEARADELLQIFAAAQKENGRP